MVEEKLSLAEIGEVFDTPLIQNWSLTQCSLMNDFQLCAFDDNEAYELPDWDLDILSPEESFQF